MRRLESLAEGAATFDAYLQEIARFPPLTADEELQLAARAQQQDEDALVRLAGSQLSLVVDYARRYARLGVPLIELVRDGNLGLLEAARRFRPARHGRFAPHALWWVRQSCLHRVTLAPGLPGGDDSDARTGHLVAALGAAIDHACATGGAAPEGLQPGDVRALDECWRRAPYRGLVGRYGDFDFDLDDLAPLTADIDEEPVRQALVSDLEASLLELDPKERRALELRLGLADGEPRTVDQIGDRLHVSAARAEHLSVRAIGHLRRQRSWRSPLN